jgi:hypothetical protein
MPSRLEMQLRKENLKELQKGPLSKDHQQEEFDYLQDKIRVHGLDSLDARDVLCVRLLMTLGFKFRLVFNGS